MRGKGSRFVVGEMKLKPLSEADGVMTTDAARVLCERVVYGD